MLKLFLLVCFTVNALVASIPLDNAVIEERILGGNDTDITQFPHQIALYIWEIFLCGGFIISPNYIITSGDCAFVLEEFDVTIRAGSSCIEEGGEIYGLKKINVHPKYNDDTKDYNVAVLELATPLKINNKTIKPIKLGTKEPSAGSLASVSGWGYIGDHKEEPETLQYVTIPVIDRTKCATSYKPKNITITPRMICAGGQGKTIHNGDVGGALVEKNEAVGIATHVLGYGPWPKTPKELPGVYTNIADPEIIKFIKDTAKL